MGKVVAKGSVELLKVYDAASANLIDPSVWKESASPLSFPLGWGVGGNVNGLPSENSIGYDVGPFGTANLVWRCASSSDGNADGGWNVTVNVDIGKSYRYCVFVKRGSLDGTTYHGVAASNGTIRNIDLTVNTNPYFWSGDLPEANVWYLLVGVVHSCQYGGAQSGTSGLYNMRGQLVSSGTDFVWPTAIAPAFYFRTTFFYATGKDQLQLQCFPMLHELNGAEPRIEEILKLKTDKLIDEKVAAATTEQQESMAKNLGYGTYKELYDAAVAGETIVRGGYIRTPLIDANALMAQELIAKNLSVLGGRIGDFEVASKLIGNGRSGTELNGNQIVLDPSNNEIILSKNGVKRVRLTNNTLTPLAEMKANGSAIFCRSGSTASVAGSAQALYASYNDVGTGGSGRTKENAVGVEASVPKVYSSIAGTSGKLPLTPAFYSLDFPYAITIVHSGEKSDGRFNRIIGTNSCRVTVQLMGEQGSVSSYTDEFEMSVDSEDSGRSYAFNRMARFNFSVPSSSTYWVVVTFTIVGKARPIRYQTYNHATTFRHSWWSEAYDKKVQYELSVNPGMSADGSIGLTELSNSGFQSVWTDHRFIRIDGNVSNPTFIQSEGTWMHNGVEVKFDRSTITGFIDPTVYATRNYVDTGLESVRSSTSGLRSYVDSTFLKSVGGSISGDLTILGNLFLQQSGKYIVTEKVYSENDFITLRYNNPSLLPAGTFTGIEAKKVFADGADGWLTFGSDGMARVGRQASLQMLATREDAPTDASIARWSATNKRYEGVLAVDLSVGNSDKLGQRAASDYWNKDNLNNKTTNFAALGIECNHISTTSMILFNESYSMHILSQTSGTPGFNIKLINSSDSSELASIAFGKTALGLKFGSDPEYKVYHEGILNRADVNFTAKDVYLSSLRSNGSIGFYTGTGTAQGACIGKLLVSNSYADEAKLPESGAWIKGDLVLAKNVYSDGYSGSGATAKGWMIDSSGNASVNNLTVRGSASFYETVINKIRATNGAVAVSDAGEISEVIPTGSKACTVLLKDVNPFMEGDILKCQHWTGNSVKRYLARVTHSGTHLELEILEGSLDEVAVNDTLIRYDSDVPERGGLVYITSCDEGAPNIQVLNHGNVLTQMGNLKGLSWLGAPLPENTWGTWQKDGYFSGKIEATSGKIGKLILAGGELQSPRFNTRYNFISDSDIGTYDARTNSFINRIHKSGFGHLANGNISWDATGNVDWGEKVKLQWKQVADNNLMTTSKWKEGASVDNIFDVGSSSPNGPTNSFIYGNLSIIGESDRSRAVCLHGTGNNKDNANAGFDAYIPNMDSNCTYRFSVWVWTSSAQGNIYLGCSQGGEICSLQGTVDTNPYGCIRACTTVRNEWRLYTFYVHNQTYGGGMNPDTGVYDTSGNKVAMGEQTLDFKWAIDNRNFSAGWRAYLFYSGDGEQVYFYNPTLYKVDGTEPSVMDMIDKFAGRNRLTKMDANGIYTGTLTAEQVCTKIAYIGDANNGWHVEPTQMWNGTNGAGLKPMIRLSTQNTNIGSGYIYKGERVLEGLSLTWHRSDNAGHLVFGQLAANGNNIKDGFKGIQMMSWNGNEYFALGANLNVENSYSHYCRIGGWAFNHYRLYGGNVELDANGLIRHIGDKWRFNNDGSWQLAGGNLYGDAAGNITGNNCTFNNGTFNGAINATSGTIGGFKLTQGSMESANSYGGGTFRIFPDDGFICFSKGSGSNYVWSGIGANVFPASSGMRVVARFENNEALGWGVNVATYISAQGASTNIAILAKGAIISDGLMTSYNLVEFMPNSSDNVLPIKRGTTFLINVANRYQTVYLPPRSAVADALNIGTYDSFCVHIRFSAYYNNPVTFNVYSPSDCRMINVDGGVWNNLTLGGGDNYEFLLIGRGSSEYYAQVLNRWT